MVAVMRMDCNGGGEEDLEDEEEDGGWRRRGRVRVANAVGGPRDK